MTHTLKAAIETISYKLFEVNRVGLLYGPIKLKSINEEKLIKFQALGILSNSIISDMLTVLKVYI